MSVTNSPAPIALVPEPHQAGARTRAAAGSTWIKRFARFGMIVRGLLFFVVGAFALRLALGLQHSAMTPQGAIAMIGTQPAGKVMLLVIAVGLAGYSVWGLIRSVLDPMGRGHRPIGIFQRLGYLTSALAYAAMFVATVRSLMGMLSKSGARDWTGPLLAHPFGGIILVIIGLCWVFGAGLMQIVQGWKGTFERDFDFSNIGPTEQRWARVLGRIGMISRGIVFTVVGMLLIAASRAHPHADVGMDGALLEILRQPFGRLLLAAAGLGLMAFGCFSAMCARWMRIPSGTTAAPGHRHPSLH